LKLILNPDKEYREKVIQAIKDNQGYCPCSLIKNPDTKCKCKEARENNICHCELFVQVED
jgi:ferredoxin-thioredoxin reductase catalytic subunit